MAVYGGTNPPVTLNGTTYVTVVAKPSAGKRRHVLGLFAKNKDASQQTFRVAKLISAVSHEAYPDVTADAGVGTQLLPAPITLDDTADLQVKILAAPGTQPIVDASWFEEP